MTAAVYRAEDLRAVENAPPEAEGRATGAGAAPAEVALKVMREGLSEELQKRFREEGEYLRRLTRAEAEFGSGDGLSLVPRWRGEGQAGALRFLAVELAAGTPVLDLLRERERLDEADALAIGWQFCRVLALLHERLGKSYADMKLENIWWQPEESGRGKGQIKVIDWNVLEAPEKAVAEKTPPRSPLPESGPQAVGREDLAVGPIAAGSSAPASTDELLAARPLPGIERDLFRTGIYLYRMLTGGLPNLEAGSPAERLAAVPAWRQVTPGAQRVVAKALAPNPYRRYGSARALQAALQSVWQLWQTPAESLMDDATRLYTEGKHSEALACLAIAESKGEIKPGRIAALREKAEEEYRRQSHLERGKRLFRAGSDEAALRLFREGLETIVEIEIREPLHWWILMAEAARAFVASAGPITRDDRTMRAEAAVERAHHRDYAAMLELLDELSRRYPGFGQGELRAAAEIGRLVRQAEGLTLLKEFDKSAGLYEQVAEGIEDLYKSFEKSEALFIWPMRHRDGFVKRAEEQRRLARTIGMADEQRKRAQQEAGKGNWQAAVEHWRLGLEYYYGRPAGEPDTPHPESPPLLVRAGILSDWAEAGKKRLEAGDLDAAAQLLDSAVAAAPDDARLRGLWNLAWGVRRARQYLEAREWGKALEHARQTVANAPEDDAPLARFAAIRLFLRWAEAGDLSQIPDSILEDIRQFAAEAPANGVLGEDAATLVSKLQSETERRMEYRRAEAATGLWEAMRQAFDTHDRRRGLSLATSLWNANPAAGRDLKKFLVGAFRTRPFAPGEDLLLEDTIRLLWQMDSDSREETEHLAETWRREHEQRRIVQLVEQARKALDNRETDKFIEIVRRVANLAPSEPRPTLQSLCRELLHLVSDPAVDREGRRTDFSEQAEELYRRLRAGERGLEQEIQAARARRAGTLRRIATDLDGSADQFAYGSQTLATLRTALHWREMALHMWPEADPYTRPRIVERLEAIRKRLEAAVTLWQQARAAVEGGKPDEAREALAELRRQQVHGELLKDDFETRLGLPPVAPAPPARAPDALPTQPATPLLPTRPRASSSAGPTRPLPGSGHDDQQRLRDINRNLQIQPNDRHLLDARREIESRRYEGLQAQALRNPSEVAARADKILAAFNDAVVRENVRRVLGEAQQRTKQFPKVVEELSEIARISDPAAQRDRYRSLKEKYPDCDWLNLLLSLASSSR